jgi:hypothetical protein
MIALRRAWMAVFIAFGVAAVAGGCGAANESGGFDQDGGPGGSGSGGKGSGGNGSGGSNGSSGASGSGGTSGSGGSSGGTIFGGSSSGVEAGVSDAMLANDGTPMIDGMTCVAGDAGPAPLPQRCVTMTVNECDGPTDQALQGLGVGMSLLNGKQGNGFDDDCDGLVDEGCPCSANGQTKPCYLVPASQVDPSTSQPVGWCTVNSRGSLDCAGNEFPTWSGVCRGGQPPYPDDICAPGDFNCDGAPENSRSMSCACGMTPVTCPTDPVTEQPYPDPANIPLIDGSQWINDPAQRPNAMNWTWTVIGGDCDNVLPHPTFAIYDQGNSKAAGARKGTRTPVVYSMTATPPRYLATPGQPLISIQAANYGNGVAGGQVHPAFGLSGDYLVQGEWDLNGTHYVCTQKVQVRAPGIRAELCWDSVGGEEKNNAAGNDIDLHFARLQGVTCATKGWDTTCAQGKTYEDCYWDESAGCRDDSTDPPGWGYADSPTTACLGWSSKRHAVDGTVYLQPCTNPRLDKDDIACDKTVDDPTALGDQLAGTLEFCGPENINLDNPNDKDAFVIGVTHYNNTMGTADAHPHVNLYCNGERVLSVGYNPLTGQTAFPLLNVSGGDYTGDYWSVATITTHVSGGQLTSCDVATVPSHHADQTRDGRTTPTSAGNQLCVDSTMSNANPAFSYATHAFIENQALQGGRNGGIPTTAAGFCKH